MPLGNSVRHFLHKYCRLWETSDSLDTPYGFTQNKMQDLGKFQNRDYQRLKYKEILKCLPYLLNNHAK